MRRFRQIGKLRKLKGRSLDELRVRAVQTVAALLERAGQSAQARVPSDREMTTLLSPALVGQDQAAAGSLLEHFRTRRTPAFFAGFNDRRSTVAELARRWPEESARIVERARRITEGSFSLLGLRDLHFGRPIDWHLEPLAGKRAPMRHWSAIDYLDPGEAGDKKIVWELNRHQYLLTLGEAYWLTDDERYAATFVDHVTDWMDRNPPKLGINWASSLEVAFRAISWLWALYFFKDSSSLTPPVFWRLLKYLYLHGRHLETYPSTYFSPNTHLTGEALGLFYLGVLLPEFRRADRWRATGSRILLSALAHQVRPDGVYFEQSSYYHRYTADFYTHFYILGRVNGDGDSMSEALPDSLTALVDHLMHVTRPDGTTPLFGDDDGGRLMALDERPVDDMRAVLANGAVLFKRCDYKYVAGEAAVETCWLLGRDGLQVFDGLVTCHPPPASFAFPNGGYYVMRDGWHRSANYLVVDCGPHGGVNGAHAHADALAFDLAARGRTLLTDPGTYTYTGSAEIRDRFRSSMFHNTLSLDEESSSAPGGPFAWSSVATASPRVWISRDRCDLFEGEHDGYTRLSSPALHSRAILFLKNDYWIVRDRVISQGQHRCGLHFHFVPGAAPMLESAAGPVREPAGDLPGLDVFVFAAHGSWRQQEGWVSRCYGARTAAPVFVFSTEAKGFQEFVTLLVPTTQKSSRTQAREVETTGGRAVEIMHEDRRDIVILKAAQNQNLESRIQNPEDRHPKMLTADVWHLASEKVSSDFEWCWIRSGKAMTAFTELVLLGGSFFSWGDREVVRASSRLEYLIARISGPSGSIDTDPAAHLTLDTTALQHLVVNGQTLDVANRNAVTLEVGRREALPVEATNFPYLKSYVRD